MTREEAISRQAVIEQTYNWSKDEFLRVTNPFDYLRKRINSLPLVTPQPKIGHWIKDGDSYSELYDYKIRCHCSICGNEKFFIDHKTTDGTPCIKNCDNVDKYCSNCGAKMEGE